LENLNQGFKVHLGNIMGLGGKERGLKSGRFNYAGWLDEKKGQFNFSIEEADQRRGLGTRKWKGTNQKRQKGLRRVRETSFGLLRRPPEVNREKSWREMRNVKPNWGRGKLISKEKRGAAFEKKENVESEDAAIKNRKKSKRHLG